MIPSLAGVRKRLRHLLAGRPVGRDLSVRDSDVFLVSYPKSGNTWLRFAVGNLIFDDGVDFGNLEGRIPDIYVASRRQLAGLPDPRVIKSHEPFDPRYRRTVYIVRDPRDVAVSYAHFRRKMGWLDASTSLDDFTEGFVEGTLDDYGSWGDHVGRWLEARSGDGDFLLLRYEDLLDDIETSLGRVAAMLEVSATPEALRDAADASSFRRMSGMEHQWDTVSRGGPSAPFMRSGQSGGWRDELPEPCAARIRDIWAPLMDELGYD